jgi:hypothetical protein
MGWCDLVCAAVGDLGSFQLAVRLQNHSQLSIGSGVAGMRHDRIVCLLNLFANRRKELLKIQLRERRERVRLRGEGGGRPTQDENRQPQSDQSPGDAGGWLICRTYYLQVPPASAERTNSDPPPEFLANVLFRLDHRVPARSAGALEITRAASRLSSE